MTKNRPVTAERLPQGPLSESGLSASSRELRVPPTSPSGSRCHHSGAVNSGRLLTRSSGEQKGDVGAGLGGLFYSSLLPSFCSLPNRSPPSFHVFYFPWSEQLDYK